MDRETNGGIELRVGSWGAIRLLSGELMPFQLVDLKARGTLAECALVGYRYADAEAIRTACSEWSRQHVVASIVVPVFSLRREEVQLIEIPENEVLLLGPRGSRWVLRVADRIRSALGVPDVELRNCSFGVMYDLANACVGLIPWDSMGDPNFFESFLVDPQSPLVERNRSEGAEPEA